MLTIPSWAVAVMASVGLALAGALLSFVVQFTRTKAALEAMKEQLTDLCERVSAVERRIEKMDRALAIIDDRQQREHSSPTLRIAAPDSGPNR